MQRGGNAAGCNCGVLHTVRGPHTTNRWQLSNAKQWKHVGNILKNTRKNASEKNKQTLRARDHVSDLLAYRNYMYVDNK